MLLWYLNPSGHLYVFVMVGFIKWNLRAGAHLSVAMGILLKWLPLGEAFLYLLSSSEIHICWGRHIGSFHSLPSSNWEHEARAQMITTRWPWSISSLKVAAHIKWQQTQVRSLAHPSRIQMLVASTHWIFTLQWEISGICLINVVCKVFLDFFLRKRKILLWNNSYHHSY